MKKSVRKILAIFLSAAMTVPAVGQVAVYADDSKEIESSFAGDVYKINAVQINGEPVSAQESDKSKLFSDETKTLENLVVKDYYKYTGRFIIYFKEIEGSKGYNLYIDDEDEPVKTISGCGGYLSKSDWEDIPEGTHRLRVVNINAEGDECEWNETTIAKQDYEELFTEIPQIYIYTDKEITTDYLEESDVTISVLDKDGGEFEDIIDSGCNIKIRGNSTSVANKKPWNIKFAKKKNLLGMAKGKKWCLLSNGYDKSLMRNRLALDFAKEIGLAYTSDSRYVDVYINGKYNGNYLLTVPVEVKKERIGIDAYNGDSNDILLELGTRYESDVNHFKTGTLGITFDVNDPEKDGDLESTLVNKKIERVKKYLTEFEKALLTKDYSKICNYIDAKSFADFYLLSELFKNADFNFSSTRFYIKDNKIYAGPVWDMDLSCGNYNPKSYDYMYEDGESYKGIYCTAMLWYEKLFECEEFEALVKKQFESRQFIIQNMYKNDSEAELSINYLVDNYGKSFERDSRKTTERGAGWSLQGGGGYVGLGYTLAAKWTQWEQPIEFVRDWLKNRNEWLGEYWDVDLEAAYEKAADDSGDTSEAGENGVDSDQNESGNKEAGGNESGDKESDGKESDGKESSGKDKKQDKGGLVNESCSKKIKVARVKIISAKKKKGSSKIRIKLKKASKRTYGYEMIFYSKKSGGKKNIICRKVIKSNKKSILVKIKKLKNKKNIYVKIRAYRIVGGKKYYSKKWSSLKKVKNKRK